MTAPQGPVEVFFVDVSINSGEPKSMVLTGIYKGTLPCADCSGLRTELRLYAKGRFDFTDAIYVSTRTYLRGLGEDQSFTDRGQWAVLKGDAVDPNATVYALDPDRPAQVQYLLLQPDGAGLTQLDRKMMPIDAPASVDLTLKRVP
ncbi:hypothetical protein ACPOL_2134 [Acidisarcina polymorpha]|uniref:Lipoprotein n=1 Tax=Acidisarcina polymorpha TaxID=2211140 RepID=A0A2Z5FX53_9BACT|nr:copper resistance protein NlpE [Acidisarcina polymorpha]AXC11458.1 hypothetical protein ACPOL_2134 [Acidisarcina polymorpha]